MSFDLSARTTIVGGPMLLGSVSKQFHHCVLDPDSTVVFGTLKVWGQPRGSYSGRSFFNRKSRSGEIRSRRLRARREWWPEIEWNGSNKLLWKDVGLKCVEFN